MKIISNSNDTAIGPDTSFTGKVYIDPITTAGGDSRLNAAHVHFSPGARTVWHSHPKGQTLFVTDGVGLIARRGGKPELIRAGDIIIIDPGEEHWHGATPNRFMSHVAMNEADAEGNVVAWLEKVSDDEYKPER